MEIASRLLSRTDTKPLALFALLIFVFFLLLGMLYRAFSQVDLVIDSIGDPAGPAHVMERLERFDADYRIQKDGTILVDGGDAARLMQAGLLLTGLRVEHHRAAQAFLMLLLLMTGGGLALLWRRLTAEPETEAAPPESAAPQGRDRETFPPHDAGEGEASEDAALLAAEHPQTVAVWLLSLEAERSAAALEAMGAAQRALVWERMARSGACDTALRARVADLFAQKQARLQRRRRSAEATEKIRAVFRRLSPETKTVLLSALRRYPEAGLVTLLEAEMKPAAADKEA